MMTTYPDCYIKRSENKGRGVYASRNIPGQTVIDVSPILYFSKDEYEAHGKYTILDHYTFKCRDGRMALALGLGSIFNHSDAPNVSYIMDTTTDTIRYTTTRQVEPDEELCIFYGQNLWFSPSETVAIHDTPVNEPEVVDGWASLSIIEPLDDTLSQRLEGDPSEIIPEQDLPFTVVKITPEEEEEEELDAIRTVQAWAVDIPESRLIATLLRWIKNTGLGAPELEHLKRIRRQGENVTLLLCTSSSPPELPLDIELPAPYLLSVPRSAALTPNSLRLKTSIWPTLFTPSRKVVPDRWSRGQVAWAWEAVETLLQQASVAVGQRELPIVAHIRSPYDPEGEMLCLTAHDTRRSTGHPLRHAVMNVIRRLSDCRSTTTTADNTNTSDARNGSNYLLTSMTLFVTHEPCIMCSMALLHSRVKQVIYLIPMEKTGGCGSLACLPRLDGVNHRFGICRWKDEVDVRSLDIESHIDV